MNRSDSNIPVDIFAIERQSGSICYLPITNNISISMVWCSPGKFLMGSPNDHDIASDNEYPQHLVTLSRGFYIGQTPVTQEQWQGVMGTRLDWFQDEPGSETLPVEGLEWAKAKQFCDTLTELLKKREILTTTQSIDLPTEAQREYACRAGTSTRWYFGNEATALCDFACFCLNSNGQTGQVGQRKPNAWGLYDLYGNVWEWCLDDYMDYKYQIISMIDPCCLIDNYSLKVLRGGSYAEDARDCRSARRESCVHTNPYNESTGFRVVCISSVANKEE